MSRRKDIPVTTEPAPPRSGEKYQTPQGFTAIRDGIKASAGSPGGPGARAGLAGKPPWLRARAPTGAGFREVKTLVKAHRLATRYGDIQQAGGQWHDWLLLAQVASDELGKSSKLAKRFTSRADRSLRAYKRLLKRRIQPRYRM